jgi:hypothetical protein
VKAVQRGTVNSLRVEKEIERVESKDLEIVLAAVVDSIKKEEKVMEQEVPVSQEGWHVEEIGDEKKEEEVRVSNKDRVEQAQVGGQLMQKFRKKVMEKYEKRKEIERNKKALEKDNVYFESNKRQKVDDDDELPLFG